MRQCLRALLQQDSEGGSLEGLGEGLTEPYRKDPGWVRDDPGVEGASLGVKDLAVGLMVSLQGRR